MNSNPKNEKNCFRNNKFEYSSILIVFLAVCWQFLYLLNTIEGDPSIYLSFAKVFFDKPFAFGDAQRVTFGATSPVFLLYFSIMHSILGLELIWLSKAIAIIVLLLSILINYKTIKIITDEKDCSKSATLRAPSLFLITLFGYFYFSNLADNSLRLYETPIVVLYTSSLAYLYFKKKWTALALLSSISYLVRPEIVIFQAFFTMISLYYIFIVQKKVWHAVFLTFSSLLPALCYHTYMFLSIGEVLPTSIVSRSLRTDGLEIFNWLLYLSKTNPQFFIVIPIFIFCCFICKAKSKLLPVATDAPHFKMLFLYSTTILFLLVVFSKTYSVRYFEFILPVFIICVSSILVLVLSDFQPTRARIVVSCIVLFCMCSWVFKITNPEYRNDSYINNRLDPDFAKNLGNIMKPNDKLAIYEIQTQYFFEQRLVSLDARVGQEMTYFIRGIEDLLTSLLRNNINFISIDEHASPKISQDPFYKFLAERSQKKRLGEVLHYNVGENMIYVRKVLENDRSKTELVMWRHIFELSSSPFDG